METENYNTTGTGLGNQEKYDWLHGPSRGRGYYKGNSDLYIRGTADGNGFFEEEETIKEAFDEDGKLTDEAQEKTEAFIRGFAARCLIRGTGNRRIIIIDDRHTAKIMELGEDAISALERGAAKSTVARHICRNALSSVYETHMNYEDESGDYYDEDWERCRKCYHMERERTVENDLDFAGNAVSGHRRRWHPQAFAEAIEHLHDCVSIYGSLRDGTFGFLGSPRIAARTRKRFESLSATVRNTLDRAPQFKKGFSLYPDIYPMRPEDELEVAVSDMLDFAWGELSRFPVRPTGAYGDADSEEFASRVSYLVSETGKAALKVEADPKSDGRLRRMAKNAREIAGHFLKTARIAADEKEIISCRPQGLQLPERKRALHIDGLPDTISTPEQLETAKAGIPYGKYGPRSWGYVYREWRTDGFTDYPEIPETSP